MVLLKFAIDLRNFLKSIKNIYLIFCIIYIIQIKNRKSQNTIKIYNLIIFIYKIIQFGLQIKVVLNN